MTYSDLLDNFKKWVVSDQKAQAYWSKVNKGTASYNDATKYSELVGKKWSDMLVETYGEADYSEIIDDIKKSIGKAYSETAYYSKNVQGIINQKAKIGMKVLEPRLDEERLNNYLEKLKTEDAEWLLKSGAVESIARSAVTDTIEANARIQQKAGLFAYLKRDGTNCCSWCDSMTGTYEFGSQPDDFWRVHKDCNCTIEYKPSKTAKISYISYRDGKKVTS